MRDMRGSSHSLSQVSACAGLLGTVGLGDTEGVPQSGDAGLQIELRGLGQECILPKVVQGEQCGSALYLGLHQSGGSDLEERSSRLFIYRCAQDSHRLLKSAGFSGTLLVEKSFLGLSRLGI